MKTAKRIQLLLSPVLIAMLALMLAVVSFGWYMAEMGDIEVEDSSVNITVNEPDGVDVVLDCIGDQYTYSVIDEVGTYRITNPESDLIGYFGQTAEYGVESNNLDKPYMQFYKVTMESTYVPIQFTKAYVHSLSIVKGNEVLLEEQIFLENETEFSIYFYTSTDEGLTLTNESLVMEELDENTEVVYMAIQFKNPNENYFKYSDIEYYGSTYKLGITFVPQEVEPQA